LLVRLGDLAAEEAAARGISGEWLAELTRQRRAVRAKVGGEWRFFAAEDAARYRDALAVAIPPGLPLSLLEPVDSALESLLRRYARTHVPFLAADPAHRWKLAGGEVEAALSRLVARGELAARVANHAPHQLDELISMGEVVWAGRGALGPGDGRVALYLRGEAPRLLALPDEVPSGAVYDALRERLTRGASFFRDLYAAAGGGNQEAVLDALWDLVWAGEVTNDVFSPLRMLGPATRRSGAGRR